MLESWRLTLVHKGNGFVAQSVGRFEGRTAGEDWLGSEESTARRVPARPTVGRFVELRDAEGRTIYRRAITQGIPETFEYPTGDADRPFSRIPMPEGKLVSVRVPGHRAAKTAAIVEAKAVKGRKSKDAAQEDGATIVMKVLVEVDLVASQPKTGGAR